MAHDKDRFAWALSFLDVFTCALGAVFMLTVLSVRERGAFEAADPAGFVFVSIAYDGGSDAAPAARIAAAWKLPAPFEVDPPLIGGAGTVVVLSARCPHGSRLASPVTVSVKLPKKPIRVRAGNEGGTTVSWPTAAGHPFPDPIRGKDYEITIGW